jgi:assimilatory nitrate reductase catalytic subunit
LRIKPGGSVRVSSRRDSVLAVACITATIAPGQVFIPMHYDIINRLTFPAFDPYSRQPAYKACAANLAAIEG